MFLVMTGKFFGAGLQEIVRHPILVRPLALGKTTATRCVDGPGTMVLIESGLRLLIGWLNRMVIGAPVTNPS